MAARSLFASALAFLAGCATPTPETIEAKLDRSIEKAARKKAVRHAVLHVDSPVLGISGTWAHGDADGSGTPMTADTPFLSASVGKLFTAVAVVSLAEEGVLTLTDPVTDWLTPAQLEGLPVPMEQVQIRHLLGHRSGLPDYFVAPTVDGTPTVFEQWASSPEQPWTREAMLGHTKDHQEAMGAPDELFHYADTNYTLLGLILESATGEASFQDVVHARVIDPLGLDSTHYHHTVDGTRIDGDWAEAWAGDTPIAHAECMTGDLAGGGLVTTTQDLGLFLRALADGDPVGFDALSPAWSEDTFAKGMDYGYGLWRVRPGNVSFMLKGIPDLVGVSGATGSFAYYSEDWDAVVTGTFDQTDWEEKHLRFLLTKTLPQLNRLAP